MAAVLGKHCRTTAGVILGLGPGTHDAAVAIGEIKFRCTSKRAGLHQN